MQRPLPQAKAVGTVPRKAHAAKREHAEVWLPRSSWGVMSWLGPVLPISAQCHVLCSGSRLLLPAVFFGGGHKESYVKKQEAGDGPICDLLLAGNPPGL